jgi:hypothetical protein
LNLEIAVHNLKEGIASPDGLLLVTPEYNNSTPASSRTPSTGFLDGSFITGFEEFIGKK